MKYGVCKYYAKTVMIIPNFFFYFFQVRINKYFLKKLDFFDIVDTMFACLQKCYVQGLLASEVLHTRYIT